MRIKYPGAQTDTSTPPARPIHTPPFTNRRPPTGFNRQAPTPQYNDLSPFSLQSSNTSSAPLSANSSKRILLSPGGTSISR
jgi:hypothetical protein